MAFTLFLYISAVLPLAAEDEPANAREIILVAQKALGEVSTVSYDFEGFGPHDPDVPDLVGHVKLRREGDLILTYQVHDQPLERQPRPTPMIRSSPISPRAATNAIRSR